MKKKIKINAALISIILIICVIHKLHAATTSGGGTSSGGSSGSSGTSPSGTGSSGAPPTSSGPASGSSGTSPSGTGSSGAPPTSSGPASGSSGTGSSGAPPRSSGPASGSSGTPRSGTGPTGAPPTSSGPASGSSGTPPSGTGPTGAPPTSRGPAPGTSGTPPSGTGSSGAPPTSSGPAPGPSSGTTPNGTNTAAPGGIGAGTSSSGTPVTTSGVPGQISPSVGGGIASAPGGTLSPTHGHAPIHVDHQHIESSLNHAHWISEGNHGEGDTDMATVHTDRRWGDLTCRNRMQDEKCEKHFGMHKHGKYEPAPACHVKKFRLKALNCALTCGKCEEFKRVMRRKLKRQERRDKRYWIVPRKLHCVDKHQQCPSYIYKCEKKSLNQKGSINLKEQCPRSCAYCISKVEKCQDLDQERCSGWNAKGFCKRPNYPRAVKFFYCARTCLMCPHDPKHRHTVQ